MEVRQQGIADLVLTRWIADYPDADTLRSLCDLCASALEIARTAETPRTQRERRVFFRQLKIGRLAVLIYTSGTTGAPKAVPLTHGNIYAESTKVQEVNSSTSVTHRRAPSVAFAVLLKQTV